MKPPIFEELSGIVWGIYLVTCLVNGFKYIGCSNNIKKRWRREHFKYPFSKGKYRNWVRLLYADIRKHGLHNFKFEVICELGKEQRTKEHLYAMEIFYVDELNTFHWDNPMGYNLTRGGLGSKGAIHTKEMNAAKSKNRTGEKRSKEVRAKMSGKNNPMFGRTGVKNPMFGKEVSTERRAKQSAAMKGKKMSADAVEKTAAANRKRVFGKHKVDNAWIEFDSFNSAANHFGIHRNIIYYIVNKKRISKKFDFKFA